MVESVKLREATHLYGVDRENMEIKRVGTQASTKGPEEWFTGAVRIDLLLTRDRPIFMSKQRL